jgi:hypothetical protein
LRVPCFQGNSGGGMFGRKRGKGKGRGGDMDDEMAEMLAGAGGSARGSFGGSGARGLGRGFDPSTFSAGQGRGNY